MHLSQEVQVVLEALVDQEVPGRNRVVTCYKTIVAKSSENNRKFFSITPTRCTSFIHPDGVTLQVFKSRADGVGSILEDRVCMQSVSNPFIMLALRRQS